MRESDRNHTYPHPQASQNGSCIHWLPNLGKPQWQVQLLRPSQPHQCQRRCRRQRRFQENPGNPWERPTCPAIWRLDKGMKESGNKEILCQVLLRDFRGFWRLLLKMHPKCLKICEFWSLSNPSTPKDFVLLRMVASPQEWRRSAERGRKFLQTKGCTVEALCFACSTKPSGQKAIQEMQWSET